MTTAPRMILLRVAYDGSDFAGYQIQNARRTVQGVLESALQRLHGHPVRTVCAGRTDAGVHAVGQYVSFETDHRGIATDRFAPAINSHLPADVTVTGSWSVPEGFHAQYDARLRHYRYYLYAAESILPHRRRFAWRIPEMPDLDRLNADAAVLVGVHDFRIFAARLEDHRSTVREVRYAVFRSQGDTLVFAIGATGFLRRMVRSIVGTLIERERLRLRGGASLYPLTDLLSSGGGSKGGGSKGGGSKAGTTAPPWGLFLHDVEYRDIGDGQ
jgi:tRNA pseudouridine38-40 synthase